MKSFKDISDIISKLKLENVYLVGHSLGGPIVSSVSSKNNKQISGVILEDPFLGTQPVDKTGRASRGKIVAEIIDSSKSNFEKDFLKRILNTKFIN